MNILPQKRWNVYNRDNRAKVDRDRRKEEEKNEEKEKNLNMGQSNARYDYLKRKKKDEKLMKDNPKSLLSK